MSAKGFLRSRLSSRQKSFLRFVYNTTTNPRNHKQYLNALRYANQVFRTSKIKYVPPVSEITITNNCNLRCPTCLYLLENPDAFLPSFISVENFRQVLERHNKEKKAEIIFLGGGEPLMHPKIDDLVTICKEYDLATKISTNGTLITKKIEVLTRLDYVNVSVDAHDQESFKKYRGGTPYQFQQIREGLKALRDHNIFFSISFVLSVGNLVEVDKMIEFAEAAEPNFMYFHNINPHGSQEYEPLTIHNAATQKFLQKMLARTDFTVDIQLPVVFDLESKWFREGKCLQPWYYFCSHSKGDVSFCCHLGPDPEIGNTLLGYDFNSPKMVGFREEIMAGKIRESCLYCQRRFMGQEYARFNSRMSKWDIR